MHVRQYVLIMGLICLCLAAVQSVEGKDETARHRKQEEKEEEKESLDLTRETVVNICTRRDKISLLKWKEEYLKHNVHGRHEVTKSWYDKKNNMSSVNIDMSEDINPRYTLTLLQESPALAMTCETGNRVTFSGKILNVKLQKQQSIIGMGRHYTLNIMLNNITGDWTKNSKLSQNINKDHIQILTPQKAVSICTLHNRLSNIKWDYLYENQHVKSEGMVVKVEYIKKENLSVVTLEMKRDKNKYYIINLYSNGREDAEIWEVGINLEFIGRLRTVTMVQRFATHPEDVKKPPISFLEYALYIHADSIIPAGNPLGPNKDDMDNAGLEEF